MNKGVTNHKVSFTPLVISVAQSRQNLESNDSALLVFGNGDGGGGALPKMLENVRSCPYNCSSSLTIG